MINKYIKPGIKVIPLNFSNADCEGLQYSVEWAKSHKKYLYVVGKASNYLSAYSDNSWILSYNGSMPGEVFENTDFRPYVEGSKFNVGDKLCLKESIYAEPNIFAVSVLYYKSQQFFDHNLVTNKVQDKYAIKISNIIPGKYTVVDIGYEHIYGDNCIIYVLEGDGYVYLSYCYGENFSLVNRNYIDNNKKFQGIFSTRGLESFETDIDRHEFDIIRSIIPADYLRIIVDYCDNYVAVTINYGTDRVMFKGYHYFKNGEKYDKTKGFIEAYSKALLQRYCPKPVKLCFDGVSVDGK